MSVADDYAREHPASAAIDPARWHKAFCQFHNIPPAWREFFARTKRHENSETLLADMVPGYVSRFEYYQRKQ